MRKMVAHAWRGSLLALALSSLATLAGGGSAADAASPWWHVSVLSAPASTNSSRSQVDVDVANLGDAQTAGTWEEHLLQAALEGNTSGFVTVLVKLPAGVWALEVHAEGGGSTLGRTMERSMELDFRLFEEFFGVKPPQLCSISGSVASGQTVECKYGTPVRPYEHIILAIEATAAAGAGHGHSQVSVSGGGAPAVSVSRALAIEGSGSSYGIQSYELTPEEDGGLTATQAGSHPFQITSTLLFNAENAFVSQGESYEVRPAALAKDLRIALPPGLVGNPTPLPHCSLRQFVFMSKVGAPSCPNDTVVGVATPIIDFRHAEESLFVPYEVDEPVYSLEPSVGEPAKFGFQSPVGPVVLDVSVHTGGGYNVVITTSNITQDFVVVGSVVTFWGVPADERHDNSRNLQCIATEQQAISGGPEPSCPPESKEQPFLILPTSCEGPWQSTVEADSWEAPGRFTAPFAYTFQNADGEPLGQDGCNRLNFEPAIAVRPEGEQASTPTGLDVGVHVPQEASLNPQGLADSAVRSITVALPEGVAVDPSGADGLQACSEEQIALDSATAPSCPDASKVATVEIRTPLLAQPLEGAMYLAQQGANPFNSLIALYLVAEDPISGVLVKLAGKVSLDEHTGRLTATFANPQLPFEDAAVKFFGGSRAPLGTPALCGSYVTSATIAPWSGNPPAEVLSPPFVIGAGPGGSPCQSPLPFSPELTGGSVNIQAGAFTPFATTMSRQDGQQALKAIELHMPPGLSGLLPGVKLCTEGQANAGTCGPESLIGETTVSVGLGDDPYTVKGGRVYMTGPYEGAPFGLSIVNPAKAGPFDLGQVVVRTRIEVDPITAALTIVSDSSGPYAIPQIIDGIPLEIKHVNVTIDRPGFTFNPTNCSKMALTGTLTSDQGAHAGLRVPFQVTNCARLGFKPKLEVSTNGRASRANGAGLDVKLAYPRAPFGSQANIQKVKVSLPRQLPSRLSTLQKACPDSTFNRNPAACPSASRVGRAKATTPLLPVPLFGPAYFVSHGGERFPELVIVLSGYGVTVQLHGETFISKSGITSSTFRTIPDVPVGTFELTLPQGPNSALAANGRLCAKKLRLPTSFQAQNGLAIRQSVTIAVLHCGKHKRRHHKRRRTA